MRREDTRESLTANKDKYAHMAVRYNQTLSTYSKAKASLY